MVILFIIVSLMPKDISAPSNFQTSIKPAVGGSFTHFQVAGCWDKLGISAVGKHTGQTKQIEWQDSIDRRLQVLLSSKCSFIQSSISAL